MLGRMPRIVLLFSVLAVVFAVSAATCGVARAGPDVLDGSPGWVRPVGPPSGPLGVVSGFDPPADPWGPGHRGVDLAAPAGAEVRAPGPGRITYAGLVAGRGVLVVDHGPLQSTYEPVTASVANGDVVRAGDPIGTLAAAGSHCAPATCLHWGARSNARYIDPLSLVAAAPGTVRLLPLGNGRSPAMRRTRRCSPRAPGSRGRSPSHASPRRSACARIRSPACTSCTTAPISARPAAPASTPRRRVASPTWATGELTGCRSRSITAGWAACPSPRRTAISPGLPSRRVTPLPPGARSGWSAPAARPRGVTCTSWCMPMDRWLIRCC